MKHLEKILFIFILLLFYTASNGLYAQKPFKSIIYETQNISFWNPCANNGAGEIIAGSVVVKIILHFNKDGHLTNYSAVPQDGVLIGQSSGDTYQATGNGGGNFDHNPSKGANTLMSKNLLHFVGPGTQIKAITKTHLTMNANGEVKVDFGVFFSECK
jgi:hypothetical protein